MKCPHCGNELEEGHLICERCGEEIRIVPDFEPEIENSITETLSTLAALQEGEDTDKAQPEDGESEEERTAQDGGLEEDRKVWAVVSFVAVLAVALIAYGVYAYHIRTVDYRIDRAREYAAGENYTEAVACLEDAYKDYPDVAQILFLEADYYYLQQDHVSAVSVLSRIIERGDYPYEDLEEAYDKIITIYANDGMYGEINELLQSCQEPDIVNMFQSYLALAPQFSYVEGSYAEVIPLKLSSNTTGTIYYTMDGSKPTRESDIYTAPLFPESGEYTISAFFVNDYGIESEVVSKTYVINLSVPNPPEIALYSGEYSEPMMISVEGAEGCRIFYTTDDSDPTADSVPYTGPIPMPLGTTRFKFVNISGDGISSEITTRTYTLRLKGAIAPTQAVNALIAKLVETGYLEDAAGHSKRQSGVFSYRFSSVLRIGENGDYYTINEHYDDGTGVLSRTDRVFLVNVYTGQAAQLGYDENGEFVANLL